MLTTGSNQWKQGLDVVGEGVAARVTGDTRLRVLADLWRSKYQGNWDFAVKDGRFHHEDGGSAVVFEVVPTKVLAFAKGQFAQTRYRFRRRTSAPGAPAAMAAVRACFRLTALGVPRALQLHRTTRP